MTTQEQALEKEYFTIMASARPISDDETIKRLTKACNDASPILAKLNEYETLLCECLPLVTTEAMNNGDVGERYRDLSIRIRAALSDDQNNKENL